MSDIQDLIHKTSVDCIEKGKAMQRERIIERLESDYGIGPDFDMSSRDKIYDYFIQFIKGEANE